MKHPLPDAASVEAAKKKFKRFHPKSTFSDSVFVGAMSRKGEGWEAYLLSTRTTFREEQQDVEANRPGCACSSCAPLDDIKKGRRCEQEMRRLIHVEDTTTLLQSQPFEIATIIVGPEKTRFTCHRALLCYHSEFFDAALHWKEKSEVVFEEDEVDEVSAFVAWCYGGQLSTEIRPEYLWLFADKIRSQRFANEAMYATLWAYQYERPAPEYAIKMYQLTVPGSKLRLLIRDSLIADGPLTRDAEPKESEIQWREIIKTGGEGIDDLLAEVMLEGSLFEHKANKEQPQCFINHWKYLEKIQTRHLEDIIKGVPRSGYEKFGGETNGGKVKGGEKISGETNGGEMKRGEKKAREVNGGEVNGGEVNGGEVNGGEVNGGEVNGGEVNGGEVNGGEVNGGGDVQGGSDGGDK